MSCPKCARVFNEDELIRILEASGIPEKIILAVKNELIKKRVAEEL